MKKRDYLSPNRWQKSSLADFEPSKTDFLLNARPLKFGRYIAIFLIGIVVFFLIFHHSSRIPTSPLKVAEMGPTIQNVTLPTLAHTTSVSAPKPA
jgi:hypothetical protein